MVLTGNYRWLAYPSLRKKSNANPVSGVVCTCLKGERRGRRGTLDKPQCECCSKVGEPVPRVKVNERSRVNTSKRNILQASLKLSLGLGTGSIDAQDVHTISRRRQSVGKSVDLFGSFPWRTRTSDKSLSDRSKSATPFTDPFRLGKDFLVHKAARWAAALKYSGVVASPIVSSPSKRSSSASSHPSVIEHRLSADSMNSVSPTAPSFGGNAM